MSGESPKNEEVKITVRNLTLAYGSVVLMHDLNFTVKRGDVFIIMGGSGCGKSTLLRNMIGLIEPTEGEVFYGKANFTQANAEERRSFGVRRTLEERYGRARARRDRGRCR